MKPHSSLYSEPSWASALLVQIKARDLSLTDIQADLLQRFHGLLTSSNRRFNLVSRNRTPTSSIEDQILESLLVQPFIEMLEPQTILDLGSGGGFPGIPLSILNPNRQFHLLEASYKRASHLLNTTRGLSLQNTRVIHDRAENLSAVVSCRKIYDLVVARAVTSLPTLIQWTRPLLKPQGFLLTYTGNQEASHLQHLLRSLPHSTKPLLIRSLDTGIRPEKPRRLLLIGGSCSVINLRRESTR